MIAEYECRGCGFRMERLEYTPDPVPPECPRCTGPYPVERVPSASSFKIEGGTPRFYGNQPKERTNGE